MYNFYMSKTFQVSCGRRRRRVQQEWGGERRVAATEPESGNTQRARLLQTDRQAGGRAVPASI